MDIWFGMKIADNTIYVLFMFGFEKCEQRIFQTAGNNLNSPVQCMRVLVTPHFQC